MKMNVLKLLSVVSLMALGSSLAHAVDRTPARDVATSSIDVKLINRCIETGQNKNDCLCVTKINKYELSLTEYKLAAKHFGRNVSGTNNSPKVTMVAHKQNSLIGARNFKERCEMASKYFTQRQS